MNKKDSGAVSGKKCPLCNQILKKKNGRYGEFWGVLDIQNVNTQKVFRW